jgi:hypothetical protein
VLTISDPIRILIVAENVPLGVPSEFRFQYPIPVFHRGLLDTPIRFSDVRIPRPHALEAAYHHHEVG